LTTKKFSDRVALPTSERYVMDTTAVIHSPESLRGEINKLNKTIEDLSSLLDSERSRVLSMESQIDALIEHLMHYVQIGDLEEDVAQDLAEIFGRDLVRVVSVHMNISLDAEVTVPVGYDLDDLHSYLDVEVNPIYTTDIEINGIEVSNIDVEV